MQALPPFRIRVRPIHDAAQLARAWLARRELASLTSLALRRADIEAWVEVPEPLTESAEGVVYEFLTLEFTRPESRPLPVTWVVSIASAVDLRSGNPADPGDLQAEAQRLRAVLEQAVRRAPEDPAVRAWFETLPSHSQVEAKIEPSATTEAPNAAFTVVTSPQGASAAPPAFYWRPSAAH